MSRKAHQDKSLWKVPSIYSLVGSYGPFRAKGFSPINQFLVLVHNSDEDGGEAGCHPMHNLAGQTQRLLLEDKQKSSYNGILVVDVHSMFDEHAEYQGALTKEEESLELAKGFGKAIQRLFQRMLLQECTFVARGALCGLLWKLQKEIRKTDPEMITELWMIHPKLSSKFINTHLVVSETKMVKTEKIPLHLVMDKKKCPRVDMLRYFFPRGTLRTVNPTDLPWLAAAFHQDTTDTTNTDTVYDPDYCSQLGKSLFVSKMTVEMSRRTKQYERICHDITSEIELVERTESDTSISTFSALDWCNCEKRVGALVLRGNRCVLVRSLEGKWDGMRIPSVVQRPNEAAREAAIRAVVECTGVESTEVQALPDLVLPVSIYGPNGRSIVVQLYPLYAAEPPPDGPLENADLEDDETPYDWYQYEKAIQKLDAPSIAALQIMALSLVQAANVGLVPSKWGGVFGQELQLWDRPCKLTHGETSTTNLTDEESLSAAPASGLFRAEIEEWQPSRQGDVLQDVRKANQVVLQRLAARNQATRRKLPVTLLSGFLGSGKTTLLSHILANYSGFKVAILVNDMGEINIDAALLQGSVGIKQSQEHMVELSNGCICCTLREDLLVEVAKIAASKENYDYLIIESSGISEPMPVAETFTFEDSTGLCLGDIAELDTLVTVVDGSKFLNELDSLDSLQGRNWHADPEDQRTISHLLCDQVEFANVIVVNKCDLLEATDKDKVKLLIQSMNLSAVVIESVYSTVPLNKVLGTGLFSMSEAEKHEGWLKEARIGEHTPETEEYGIGSFTFRAIKPFHPRKLHDTLEVMLNHSEAPFDASIILRAKGFVWLANWPQLQGDFSLAGNHYSLLPGNPWWAEIDKSLWPENLESNIAPLWHEPHGDRQQEIVLIGQSLNKEAIIRALNECLVSAEDFIAGQEAWDRMCESEDDPFQQEWQKAIDMAMKEAHEHDHTHSHDHGHSHSHSHD